MAGLVVQYDPWTVMGNVFIQKLFDAAHTKADEIGIERSSRIPIALAGYADVESAFHMSSVESLHTAICKSNSDKFRGYELAGVLKELNAKQDSKKPGFDYERLARNAVPWWGELEV